MQKGNIEKGDKATAFFLPPHRFIFHYSFFKPDGRGDAPPLTPSCPGDFTLDLN